MSTPEDVQRHRLRLADLEQQNASILEQIRIAKVDEKKAREEFEQKKREVYDRIHQAKMEERTAQDIWRIAKNITEALTAKRREVRESLEATQLALRDSLENLQ